jgi:squalene monooxygenase
MPTTTHMYGSYYDVVIVGAGVAGSSLAHALATLPRMKPLRIALLERSLAEPDRIVGELLQPGGLAALRKLGMSSCVENIDAITVQGYLVVENGQSVQIPYPTGNEGRSFHHGRFVMALRETARRNVNVDVIELTVSELLECQYTGRVIGVRGSQRDSVKGLSYDPISIFGSLVVVADGCFSNFRSCVLGDRPPPVKTKSYFVGAILKNAVLPVASHGTVVLAEGHQPILLYQISKDDTRMLIDIQLPLPANIRVCHHHDDLSFFFVYRH